MHYYAVIDTNVLVSAMLQPLSALLELSDCNLKGFFRYRVKRRELFLARYFLYNCALGR